MAKNQPETTQVSEPSGFDLSLDEYCAQLSQTDRRVELIGGFFAVEKKAGRTKDTAAAFAQRFDAFASMPA